MSMGSKKVLVLMVVFLILGGLDLSALGVDNAADDRGDRSFTPFSTGSPWTDTLDDTSHVYLPPTGLVNVEVNGGDAHLKAGESDGWIASEVITCPDGYRYDLVYLEVETPGNSYVEVSMLNASASPSEIGFANETIGGFKLRKETDLSVYSIGPKVFPRVRIQVTFHANGSASPRLLAWSLYYIDLETWRDDFLGTGKMSYIRKINLTGGDLLINLSSRVGPGEVGDYKKFPPIAASGPDIIYPNAARTGYNDPIQLTLGGTGGSGALFDDLNGDGHLDAVFSLYGLGAKILWGDGSDTWSDAGSTVAPTDWIRDIDTGDFNGDGEIDIAMANAPSPGVDDSEVYLNKGDGKFGNSPDIVFTGLETTGVETGDVDMDGYDDILFTYGTIARLYLGGPTGPDKTVDRDFSPNGCYDAHIGDLDGDGLNDLALAESTGGKSRVFLGGPNGLHTPPDYSITGGDAIGAGDINGDGFIDIVYGGSQIHVYTGNTQGWSDSRRHDITPSGNSFEIVVGDLDKDGHDDIVHMTTGYQLEIYFGGETLPTSPDITKTTTGYQGLGVAIPKGKGSKWRYQGTTITEDITVPVGKKWDIVYLEGTTPPNTSMAVSVLDSRGRPIAGYNDLTTMSLDLSGIMPDLQRTIRVRVKLLSEFNNTTPTLEMVMVKWMDIGIWRDEFYGPAKVERMMNLDVTDGLLGTSNLGGGGPQLLFTSIKGDENYTTSPLAFFDSGGGDYLTRPPLDFGTKGTSAVDVADVNADGLVDVVFAVHRKGDTLYRAKSPLYFGTPVGMRSLPDHEFPTTGARDVLLRDLNDDGHTDVVFAQEQDEGNFAINSTLFWGSIDGWNTTPDIEFVTRGASGMDAVDIDGDDLLDLVFACYKDTSTSTDSMVFLQEATGFCGTVPSYNLQTEGARGVASGDLDKDGLLDLVFANTFSGGFAEIDSYIYWAKAGGGFEVSPTGLLTSGAQDVKLADVDTDGDLDVVFANMLDNTGEYDVSSYVYLNDGSGGFASTPDWSLPSMGARAVAVSDIDGTGWMDLVFACQRDESTHNIPSVVYLGGPSGWDTAPDIRVPTEGATDIVVTQLVKHGSGGYLSTSISPEDARNSGTYHTFRYTADIHPSHTGTLQLVDAVTWEVLAETSILSGQNEWVVADKFKLREHPSIRVIAIIKGLDSGGTFEMDDLWLNWTERIERAPEVLGLDMDGTTLYRTEETTLWINVSDEYDLTRELQVTVRHRLNGTSGSWETYLLGSLVYDENKGTWRTKVLPKVSAPLGVYDFQVTVTDSDFMYSPWIEFPELLEVLNNVPTAPEVEITPLNPKTTSTLKVSFIKVAMDVESSVLTYHYQWFQDGERIENATGENLPSFYTSKVQNWSVEVRAFDGDEEGLPGLAWILVENAPPQPKDDLPDPQFDEDTTDSDWIDLSTAFEDPDGDILTWSLESPAVNLGVMIDPDTGVVTLTPASNWFGEEILTFIASDGEFNATQTVTVLVMSVNDIPSIATVDGNPVTSDTITYTIKQGELLEIRFALADVEGDEVIATVNSSAVTLDEVARLITFQADNDAVGTLRFGLRIYDVVSTDEKVSLNFIIVIENENDEMDDPWITSPTVGETFKVNQSFSLVGRCDDPDIQWGQVLNYTWESNISGILGYGSSLTVRIMEPGIHRITLTVRDPDFAKTVSVDVVIKPLEDVTPPPPPDGNDEPASINWVLWIGLVAVLGVVGAAFYVLSTKRRTEEAEAADEEEYKREHMERAHEAVKAAAEYLEAGREEAEVPAEEAYEEIEIQTDAIPSTGLSMEAHKTEAATAETEKLWAGISETEESEEEREALRLENLKRSYQNAIGRLPYGIPSKELADRDWVDLANALATGEKETLPDGQETTEIDGRWYYSDVKDTGTFLKEHGAKPKMEEVKKEEAAPAADKTELLAKLEERFIMGEISEKAYNELKKKYGG
jgi:hypothetical protein